MTLGLPFLQAPHWRPREAPPVSRRAADGLPVASTPPWPPVRFLIGSQVADRVNSCLPLLGVKFSSEWRGPPPGRVRINHAQPISVQVPIAGAWVSSSLSTFHGGLLPSCDPTAGEKPPTFHGGLLPSCGVTVAAAPFSPQLMGTVSPLRASSASQARHSFHTERSTVFWSACTEASKVRVRFLHVFL